MPTTHDTSPTHPAGVRLPEVSVRRIVVRFVVTAIIGLAVLAAVTAFISRRVGTEESIDEAQRIAWITGKGIVEPNVTAALVRGEPQARVRFDRLVRDNLLQGSLVRVKLWDESGRIVYSDEPRLVGQRIPLDEDGRTVIAGGTAHAEISDLSKPENRFEPRDSKLLEVYTRIAPAGMRPMLFESYFSYSAVTTSGRRLWLSFAPVVLGALILLQLLQFPLAWSMARRLRRGQAERERLLRNAVEASDAERRRIARDLHDGTVQDLVGVSFELSAAARDVSGRRGRDDGAVATLAPDREVIDRAAERVRAAIRSLRTLLVEIYPPDLAEQGLEPALADMMDRLPARGIRPTLDVKLPDTTLRPETVALVYRCAQEITRNAVKHAGAARLDMCVDASVEPIRMVVTDDGRGFDPRASRDPDGHVGLRVLSELVAEAGGTVVLASAPGSGTRVTVEIPR